MPSARTSLEDTELRAPNDGVILSRVREPGAIVAPADIVFVLSLTEPVWVRTYVAEPDLGRIHPGMKVKVDVRYDARTSPMTARSASSRRSPNSRRNPWRRRNCAPISSIACASSSTSPEPDLRQGMPVTVRFPTLQAAEQ